MKLSAFLCSYGQMYEAGATTLQLVELAARQGFGAVEPFPTDDMDTLVQARALRDCARDNGLAVSCFSAACALLNGDRQTVLKEMKQRIDMAAAMGAPYFHHTIHPPLKLPRLGEMDYRAALSRAEAMLRELCAYAQDRGVLCVYEDQGMLFNGCQGMAGLIERMEGAQFGLVADVGNILFVDERPEDFIARFSDRIVHVHIKDYLWKSGGQPSPGRGWYVTRRGDYLRDTIPGHGVVSFPAVFRVLERIAYTGWCSLEYAAIEPAKVGIEMALENLRNYWALTLAQKVSEPAFHGVYPVFDASEKTYGAMEG